MMETTFKTIIKITFNTLLVDGHYFHLEFENPMVLYFLFIQSMSVEEYWRALQNYYVLLFDS